VRILSLELTTPKAAKEVAQCIEGAELRVLARVNNAAFGGYGFLHEQPLEKNLQMIQLDTGNVVALSRLLLPGMIKRGRSRKRCGTRSREQRGRMDHAIEAYPGGEVRRYIPGPGKDELARCGTNDYAGGVPRTVSRTAGTRSRETGT
jgi:hypothetical protein